MTTTSDSRPETAPGGPGGSGRERGFTLMVALMVMALLTTLGLTLMFTSETERSISRNFAGTIQAGYAAEAIVDAAVQALLFDLKNDRVGGWANRYLVVCDQADATLCASRYGFNPTTAPCYNTGTPTSGCVYRDTTGALTGSSGNWVADLTWRPSGTPPTFPSQVPIRIHPDLKAVLPWWKKLEAPADPKNPSDPDALNTGGASLALTSVCAKNCTSPSLDPADEDFSKKQLLVTGIGQAVQKVQARISKTKNPATRAVSVRVLGDLLQTWGNALVGGSGGSQTQVIEGDYLIRGSVLMFNDDINKKVLSFTSANTGVVNNYYDSDSIPAISGWWWKDARPCTTVDNATQTWYCNANNTANPAYDSDSDASTFMVEPIFHHLPNPPDQDKGDSWPGGYRSDSPFSGDYPGPEGLDAIVRLRKGIIEIANASAGLGRVETLEGGSANPGHFWDNLLGVYMNDTAQQTPDEIVGANKDELYRNVGTTWDIHTKTGSFDIEAETLKFPKLTDPYTEALTREQYSTYYDFLRPASPSDTHPGGWALDLSGLDGLGHNGLGRNFLFPGSKDCWPRGENTGGPDDISPTAAELSSFFDGTIRFPWGCLMTYAVDTTDPATTCGDDTLGSCPAGGCDVVLKCSGASCGTASCPATITVNLPTRKAKNDFPADPDLNLDTSSSLDAPKGRMQATAWNSFAYKLYMDILDDLTNNCTSGTPTSNLWKNNLENLPAVFKATIPSVYQGDTSSFQTTCNIQDNGPCFQERSAYLDVHIQLPDFRGWTGMGTVGWNTYPRWLSVRYRPSGAAAGVMTILADPRLEAGCTNMQKNDISGLYDNSSASRFQAAGIIGGQMLHPVEYLRAQPVTTADTVYRDMPTGAFVVALHLPCTDDLSPSNRNPYKCTQSDTPGYKAPFPSYPGFYTHILAWAPKYTQWRVAGNKTFSMAFNSPPSIAPSSDCGCTGQTSDVSWFAQSLLQANMTTLWNEPAVIGKGTSDQNKVFWLTPPPTWLGYRLNVPFYNQNEPLPNGTGLDRRTIPGQSDSCTGASTPKIAVACGVDVDGLPCNGNQGPDTGCPVLDPPCGVGPCNDEPDYVKSGNGYGGCTEIFTPIVKLRVPGLDPEGSAWNRVIAAGHLQDCSTRAKDCTGPNCYFSGVDPDLLASWGSADYRYLRVWPGWGSISVLEGAGMVFTNDRIRLGSPKRTCDVPTCDKDPVETDCYNCGANTELGFDPAATPNETKLGYFSDPIVFDGRLILYAGTASTSGSTKVYFHDHLLPRTKFGCSDFLSVLSNGNSEIDMQMGYTSGATKRHLLAAYSLTQGLLKVTTSDNTVGTELVGSWIADGADFGSHPSGPPVQIIGAPAVADDACDHPYLPGRDPVPQRQYISFVEDETLASGL